MSRTPRTLSRWIRRPHRRTWLPDTRDTEYSAGRLIGGYPERP